MDWKRIFGARWFAVLVNALWLVSSAFVLFLLSKIDGIVHGDLYNFGLRFSLDWATSYWLLFRLVYAFLAIPMLLSTIALVFSFLGKKAKAKKAVINETKGVSQKSLSSAKNHMLISCPHCKKLFSKPLVMLDFSNGRTRLVNVCPHCNAKLEELDNREPAVSTGILDSKEEVSK